MPPTPPHDAQAAFVLRQVSKKRLRQIFNRHHLDDDIWEDAIEEVYRYVTGDTHCMECGRPNAKQP